MQGGACPAPEWMFAQRALDQEFAVFLGDCRQGEDLPWLLLENMADKIVLMQPLHNDDNATGGLIIETAQQRMIVPLVDALAPGFGKRFVRLQGVVQDQHVPATAGKDATNRGCHAAPLCRCSEVVDGVPISQPGCEQRLVPAARHDAPAIASHFLGEFLTVAGADDMPGGMVAEIPGWKGDGRHMRLELPRRQQDGEATDPSLAAGFELCRDQLEMRRDQKRRLWVQLDERMMRKAHEIAPKNLLQLCGREHQEAPSEDGRSSGSSDNFSWRGSSAASASWPGAELEGTA